MSPLCQETSIIPAQILDGTQAAWHTDPAVIKLTDRGEEQMPFKGKTKHDIVTEFRNAEILEAARKIFAQNGFSGASVEAIAQEAGIAKGTLYLYYSSKTEIYWAALKNGLVGLCQELKKQVEAAHDVEDKIRAYLTTKLSYFEHHRDFFRIYYAEFGNAIAHPDEFHKDFRELYYQQQCILKDILAEGAKQKRTRDLKLESIAFAVFDVTRGAITQRLLGYSDTNMQEDIEFLCDFIWKGIARQ